jgi:hypothetical protein
LAALAVASALIVLPLAWLGIRGLLARNHLERARPEVTAIRDALVAGDTTAAADRLAQVQHDARSARRLTSDPVWHLAEHTPYLGRTLRTTASLTRAVDTITQLALPGLITAGDALSPSKLRHGESDFDLGLVAGARPPLERADATITDAAAAIAALPTRGVLGVVTTARNQVADQLGSVGGQVHNASLAAQLLPPMLGADGPRRYFLAMQNSAESRATGGLLGAYGILEADHGTVRLVQMDSNDNLPAVRVTAAEAGVPPEFVQRYGEWGLLGPKWYHGNLSPHFPYAAQMWAAMWQKSTGQPVDGAIALDPATLSYLLDVMGPVTLGDGTKVDGDNVVDLLLHDEYERYPDPSDREERKQFLVGVAGTVVDHILKGGFGSSQDLLSALGRAAGQRRLLIAAPAHPAEEAVLADTPVGGGLPETPQPFAGLVVNGAGGFKLDYYLQRRLVYSANTCTAGRRPATVVITLTNAAPTSGLPEFVVNGIEAPAGSFVRGQNRLWVSYYATAGAGLDRATIDGLPLRVTAETERGHPVFSAYVPIDAGATRTITLSLSEPAAPGPVLTPVQPLVADQRTTTSVAPC